MTRLTWGSFGSKLFEGGVDRGVLYPMGQNGIPWNGLKNVLESPNGSEPRPFYQDGYKYLNVASSSEFLATLSAYSSPREFDQCDGMVDRGNGLLFTQQKRQPFNLCYRTLVGNDASGIDHGYKIHLVYDALASPSTKDQRAIGAGIEPVAFSWSIETRPPKATGIKPTSHFVIDSRLTPPELLTMVEDVLYGNDLEDPVIPDVQDLIFMFKYYDIEGYGTGPYGIQPYGL